MSDDVIEAAQRRLEARQRRLGIPVPREQAETKRARRWLRHLRAVADGNELRREMREEYAERHAEDVSL